MVAFLNVGHLFVKGVSLSLTQQDARAIMDSISNDIRFSQSPLDTSGMTSSPKYFCVGGHRYKFVLGYHVDSSTENPQENAGGGSHDTYGLVRQDVSVPCPAPAIGDGATNPVEMLSNNMQLNDLHFGPSGNNCNAAIKLCTITINLVFYGADNSVFVSPSGGTPAWSQADAHCTGADLDNVFCASTAYTTTVLQSFQ